MKIMKILLVIAVLLLQIGCTDNSTNDLRYKYHLLKFNMPVDEIIQTIGTPYMKLPEVIGETWIWIDQDRINRISVYITPRMKWTVPETDYTPKVTLDTGRLIYKQWLNHGETI